MLLVMSFLLAMLVTIAWMPLFGRLAPRLGIIDRPGGRKVHSSPIPRIGGIAMALGVGVAAAIVVPLTRPDLALLAAAALLTIFGAVDDRLDLDYRLKFAGQLAAAAVVIFGGDIQIHALTLDDRYALPPWISVPATFIFLIGITNAINLADGLDGLAGGTTFLCLCALAILSYTEGETACAALSLAFAGAVLGFLRFNTYPASIFMGDAGSQLLGFAVGVLSLRATQGPSAVVSAATPVLLLALPILDTLSVMVQRLSEGRSPFAPDKNHIHHKLLALGFDHHEAVMVIYAIQADLFLLAYWMRFESDIVILAVVSAFFLGSIGLLQWAGRRWRFRSAHQSRAPSPVASLIQRLRKPANLPRWSYISVAVASLAYSGLVIVDTVRLSADVRLLEMALLTVTVILFAIMRGKPLSLVEKGSLYVTATVLVYLDSAVIPGNSRSTMLAWIAIGTMGLGTAIRMRLAGDWRFKLTPLDLIVVFVALVLPSLPDTIGLPDGGASGLAKLVVLLYAIEMVVSRIEFRVDWLRMAASVLLAGLVVRPLL